MPFLLLILAALPAQAAPACRALKSLAREMKVRHGPSTNYYVNCGPGEFHSSNYANETDPDAPMEMHVIGVREGSFPAPHEQAGDGALAVRVIVYKTEKPVLLVLSAEKPVVWDVTLTQDATVDRVILQGMEPQRVHGIPEDIPVTRRSLEAACGYAYGWEDQANRYGGQYRMLISSLRCGIGLRETSFQGCYSGAVFEIPYYRREKTLRRTADASPACPLDIEPDVFVGIPEGTGRAPESRRKNPPREARDPPDSARPRADAKRSAPEPAPEEKKPAERRVPSSESLGRPDAIAARNGVPIRAIAILLKGDRTLLTHDAIPDLIAALEKGGPELRSRAAEELGNFGPAAESSAKPLMRALKDSDARVRSSAALALGNIGVDSRKAVRLLKRALKDEHPDVRYSAKTALERLGEN